MKYLGQISQSEQNKELTWNVENLEHVARCVYMHTQAQKQPPGQHTHSHTPPQRYEAEQSILM